MPRTLTSVVAKWYALALVVLPASALVLGGIPYEVREGTFAAFALGAALLALATLFLFKKPEFLFPTSPLVWVGIPLFLVAGVSALQGNSQATMSLWGFGFEVGTLGSLFLFAVAIVAGALVPHSAKILRVFVATAVILGVVCAATVFFFPDSWGKSISEIWPQVSFLIAAALIVALVCSDRREKTSFWSFYTVCASALMGTFVFFFHPVAALLCIFTTALVRGFFFFTEQPERRVLPIYSGVAVLLLALLLAFGMRGPLPHLSPDIRLSLRATELIASPTYLESLPNALIGRGPNTFSRSWDRYRAAEFNMAPRWDVTPESAYSSAATLAIELGVLGLFALLLCPIALVYGLAGKTLGSLGAPMSVYGRSFAGALTLTLFLFGALLIYPIGIGLLLLAGLALGMCAGSLSEDAVIFSPGFVGRTCIIFIFAAGGAGLLWVSARQFAASYYHARAASLKSVSLIDAARSYEWAAEIWPISRYAGDASLAYLRYAFASSDNGGAATSELAQTAIGKTRRFADEAVIRDGMDYDATLSRASVYVSLVGAHFADAVEPAHAALDQARGRSPSRPEPPFLLAVLAVIEGKPGDARTLLNKALDLKPDYEDAQKLLAQLEGQR